LTEIFNQDRGLKRNHAHEKNPLLAQHALKISCLVSTKNLSYNKTGKNNRSNIFSLLKQRVWFSAIDQD